MPRWLEQALAYWSPTAALVKDVERLRWELREWEAIVEQQGKYLGLLNDRLNLHTDRLNLCETRLRELENSEVPETIMASVRQIRQQTAAMVADAGLPGSPTTTAGGDVPPGPRTPLGVAWIDGQPPV